MLAPPFIIVAKAVAELGRPDPKHLGAQIGLTAVLHSWGSALARRPHVHVIVPGGGISLDGERWISCTRKRTGIGASRPCLEVCLTLRWRGMDSNLRLRVRWVGGLRR